MNKSFKTVIYLSEDKEIMAMKKNDGMSQAVLNSEAVFDIDTLVADDPPTVIIMDPYSGKVAPIVTKTR